MWWGRAAGVISGSHHLADGQGVLDWPILGLVFRFEITDLQPIAGASEGR